MGKYRSSSPRVQRWNPTGEPTDSFKNKPPFSVPSQPLSLPLSASFQAMIRNHNLMLHCQTVSTSILWGELNDLLVGLKLWLPHTSLRAGRVGSNHLYRLIIEAHPSLCNMLITPVLWTCSWRSNSASLMPPSPLAWSRSPLTASLMLPHRPHHRASMSASITILFEGNYLKLHLRVV